MTVSNTELALQIQEVIQGQQSFVNQTINWLTSTQPTERLEDPYTQVGQDVGTPYGLANINVEVANAQALITQAQVLLTDVQTTEAELNTYDTTFTGYLTTAATAVQDASDFADAAEDSAQDSQGYATQAALAVSAVTQQLVSAGIDSPIIGWDAVVNGSLETPDSIVHTNSLNSQEKVKIEFVWNTGSLIELVVSTSTNGGTTYVNGSECTINYTDGLVSSWAWSSI